MSINREISHREDRTARAPSDPAAWHAGTSFQLGAGASNAMKLEDVKEAGLRCIELAWRNDAFDMLEPNNEQRCEQLVRDARELDIEVWTMHLPYGTDWDISAIDVRQREAALSRHLRLLRMAGNWNIRTAVLHPSWEPVPEAERAERLNACKLALSIMAEEAQRLDVRIAVECLPRTCLGNTSGEMKYLIDADERLGVCCDVNHLFQEAPEHFIRELGFRIISVHMSDNDGTDEKHWLPGKGIIRWNEVISALVEQGYEGPFMFEARPVEPFQLAQCWNRLLAEYNKNPR